MVEEYYLNDFNAVPVLNGWLTKKGKSEDVATQTKHFDNIYIIIFILYNL